MYGLLNTPHKTDIPKTGDSTNLMAFIVMLLAYSGGLAGTFFYKRCKMKKSQSINLLKAVMERDKNNRRVVDRRSYNLYSDVQKGENVVVEIPAQAGEKNFKYEQKVKLINPKLYGRGYAIGDMGHTDYVLVADDTVPVEEK